MRLPQVGSELALATTFSSLWRHPGYALTVILTLALGIGAATTVFALVHGILLSALPYPQAERLVLIRNQNATATWNTSAVDLRAIAELGKRFEAVAATRSGGALIGSGETAHWANARWATDAYFKVMGVAPQRGRGFVAGEDRPGTERVVVLGHAYAERQFAGRGDPLGQILPIDGLAHTVVGVMPPGVENWAAMRADIWPIQQIAEPTRRGPFPFNTIARLKPDATLASAAADLQDIGQRIFPLWQQGVQDATARLAPFPLHAIVVGGVADSLWVAFGAVVVLLLIGLVNNANLMLMRVAQRAQDLSVRAALGASRWRLARLLMSENLLLVTLGALAGLALSQVLLAEYRALGPAVPRLAEVSVDLTVYAFAAALALICAFVFALLPLAFGALGSATAALHASRSASAGNRSQRLRDGLVVLEFALALPLLVAAGLLVDSLVRLQSVDPGFDSENLLTARVRLSEDTYPDDAARVAFWQRALPTLANLPGVRSVALSGVMPPNCGCYNNFDIVGRPAGANSQPQTPWIPADSGFFETLGLRVSQGRGFDSRDTPTSQPVILVSESWAERYFPGEDAVGKQLYEGGDTEQPVTVIGVVGDIKFDGLEGPGDAVFGPVSQGWGDGELYLILRTAVEPLSLATPLRRALLQLDPTLAPTEVDTMENLLSTSLGGQRHWTAVIAAFALSAVLLAAVGVFGVQAYHVANREREIGIRQALGADARRIVSLVLQRGMICAAIGIGAGSILALFLTRALESQLFEVQRTDPWVWASAWAMLLLVGSLACWLPARRAARVDPLIALRQE